jgi:SAM-dependent methyltransferase
MTSQAPLSSPSAAPALRPFARSVGEIHQRHLVPALFEPWTRPVLDAANVSDALRVADIACGTGVLTRAAACRAGTRGFVVGADANEEMLAVARSRILRTAAASTQASIVWQHAQPDRLPFADESFDAVVCQFGLMFFADRVAAIREMNRILRPGGRMVLTVWDTVELSAGFSAELQLLQVICGPDVAAGLALAYSLGEPTLLRAVFRQAGIPRISITTRECTVRFPSPRFWIYARIKGSTLATRVEHTQFTHLLEAADRALAPFAARDGKVAFAAAGHVIVVNKSQ